MSVPAHPPFANGKAPRSALKPITKAVNGEQAYLWAPAADAFMAMNAESERRFGVTLRVASARVAYRDLAGQDYFWDLYLHHGGNLAARPGTSNHGLGMAVDLATPQMRAIVDRIGEKYGWAKKWSDAPSEWWHLTWRPGDYAAVRAAKDPLTDEERRWAEEYKKLQALKRPTAAQVKRRKTLYRTLKARRQSIYREAQKSGWAANRRRDRYRLLFKLTN